MPTHEIIAGYVAGDRLDIRRGVTNIPAGRSIVKAWFTAKLFKTDADPGLLQKVVTTAAQNGVGQITDDGAGDQVGEVLFQLSAADTGTALGPDRAFFYDVQLKFDNGDIATLVYGEISFVRGVTDAAV